MRARAAFIKCLTGYVDPIQVAEFSGKTMPIRERPLDIVYRAAHLPYWFGSQGQLKHRIADIVARRAAERGLRTDISTEYGKTITSNQWFYFLASSKTIIGCESGSSVLDPRGEIQKRIRAMLAEAPELSFEDVSRRLPAGWDGHRFFAIGPRHLEAIITRTCQILVEGEYDGVLLPHRHYLPLRRDFGNLDEVLAMIKDDALLEATANRAYAEIIEGGKLSYVAFASQLDAVVPRKLHTRSQFAWFVICCLIEVTVRVRNWLAPPAARVALCTRGLIHTMKRGVKAGLRLLGVNFRRTPAPSAMSDAPGDESIRPAA
jgi:hypothetical protein